MRLSPLQAVPYWTCLLPTSGNKCLFPHVCSAHVPCPIPSIGMPTT